MSSQQHIKPLTSIRALAALWVVFVHLNGEFSALCPAVGNFKWLIHSGGLGVDLFFVLSGFILCYSHLETDGRMSWKSYLQFIWLRLARIYPAYLAAMASVVAFVIVARHFQLPVTSARYPISVLLPEFFMVHMWSWQNYQLGWNAVDWSVSAEWFAYLCIFPVAWLILTRIKAVGWQIPAVVFLLAALALPWPQNPGAWSLTPPPLVMIALEFLAGAMLYGLRRNWTSPATPMLHMLMCLAIGIAILPLARPELTGQAGRPVLIGCFGLIILALSYGRGIFSAALSWRPLVYLGEISYSLYLIHEIIQRILKVILHPERFDQLPAAWRWLFFTIYWVAILGAAAALFHWVEHPCRRFLRRISPFENRQEMRRAAH